MPCVVTGIHKDCSSSGGAPTDPLCITSTIQQGCHREQPVSFRQLIYLPSNSSLFTQQTIFYKLRFHLKWIQMFGHCWVGTFEVS